MTKYDVLIIGAGAAGLTAAIYTCRKKLKTLVVSIMLGGETTLTTHIENYPGVGKMDGTKLMDKFRDSAEKFGAEIIIGKTTKVEKLEEKHFKITLDNRDTYESKSLILAYGKVPRTLGIEGEDKFMGRGVSTCVTCDAPFYKNRPVAVIGGGNSAVEGALELAELTDEVYLIHRRDSFRADEITVDKLKENKNIRLELNSQAKEIIGEKNVEGIKTTKKEIKVDGVFIEIGYVVDTKMVEHLVDLNKAKEIIKDERGATSCPGIFTAGDVSSSPYKQTVISAGQGATAALECHKFLTN
tara:strand:+ start:455 stop:1351 length:897 start_codon:yes stop_codon:yes gene_type:complete